MIRIEKIQSNGFFKGDRPMWVILLFLSIISVLAVSSASGSVAFRQNSSVGYYIFKHLLFLIGGFGLILLQVKYVPVSFYRRMSLPFLIVSFALLLLNLLVSSNRSLPLFGGLSFQPQEFVKLSLIMYVSTLFAKCKYDLYDVDQMFWKVLGMTGFICLIISFRDISTAALLFATIFVLMLAVGVRRAKLLGVVVALLVLVVSAYLVADIVPKEGFSGRIHTFKSRIDGFIDGTPQGNSNVELGQDDYFKYSIYKGGHGIAGPGRSKMRVSPAADNDFVYSVIVEEYSLVLGIVIIFLYAWVLYRGAKAGDEADDPFSKFVALGLAVLITFQAFMNIGVNVGLFPVTGQPLPWVSMGGTSMLVTAGAFGVIISVSYQNEKDREEKSMNS
ncbi:MAG: FtsW/RodA/SpoVE family cell cycle protein [Bacteroidales bacterium]